MQHDVMGGGDRDGVRFGGNARYTLFLQTGLFHLYMHGVYLILQKLQLWLQLKIQLAHRPRFLRKGLSFHIISRRLLSPIIFRSSIQNWKSIKNERSRLSLREVYTMLRSLNWNPICLYCTFPILLLLLLVPLDVLFVTLLWIRRIDDGRSGMRPVLTWNFHHKLQLMEAEEHYSSGNLDLAKESYKNMQ